MFTARLDQAKIRHAFCYDFSKHNFNINFYKTVIINNLSCIINEGRINCTDSLFWYADITQTPCESFDDRDFVPIFDVDFGNNTALKTQVENKCMGSGTDKQVQNCIYDYFVTRNEDLASATLSTQVAETQESSALGNLGAMIEILHCNNLCSGPNLSLCTLLHFLIICCSDP